MEAIGSRYLTQIPTLNVSLNLLLQFVKKTNKECVVFKCTLDALCNIVLRMITKVDLKVLLLLNYATTCQNLIILDKAGVDIVDLSLSMRFKPESIITVIGGSDIKLLKDIPKLNVYKDFDLFWINLNDTKDLFRLTSPLIKPRVFKRVTESKIKSWISYNKFENMSGQTITIASFHHPLTTIVPNDNSTNVDGIEIMIINEFAKLLNFNWTLKINRDHYQWGIKLNSTHYVGGIVGATIAGEADLALGQIWVSHNNYVVFDMSRSWSQSSIVFVVAKITRKMWKGIFVPFTNDVWAAVGAMVVILSVCLWGISRGALQAASLSRAFTQVFGTITLSADVGDPPARLSARTIRLTISLFGLIMSTAYSGTITSHFTRPSQPAQIDTLDDLIDHNYFWGKVRPEDVPLSVYFLNQEDKRHMILQDRFQPVKSITELIEKLKSGKYALQGETINRQYLLFDNISSHTNIDTLRIVPYPLITFDVAMGFPRGSLLQHYTSLFIQRALESGLIGKWINVVIHRRGDPDNVKIIQSTDTKSQVTEIKPLSLANLQGAFITYLIMLLVSIVVFILELFSVRQKKH